MKIFNSLITNVTCLFFPIMLYLVYFANIKNLDLEEKSIFFEIAIFSSTYLLFRNINSTNHIYILTILNIPLLITSNSNERFLRFTSVNFSIIEIQFSIN